MLINKDISSIFDDAFKVPTVWYKGDDKLYKSDRTTPIGNMDLKNPELNEPLLSLAKRFSGEGDGIIPEIELLGDDIFSKIRTVIWCDIKERLVKNDFGNFTCTLSTEGQISLTYEGVKIIFDPDKFHGVTPESIRVRITIAFFDEKKDNFRYVEIPLKTKYLPLVDDMAEIKEPEERQDAVGKHLKYTLKLRGRQEKSTFLIPVKKGAEDALVLIT